MKKVFLYGVLFLMLGAFTACDNDDNDDKFEYTLIEKKDLPSTSVEFLDTHFAESEVIRVEKKNIVDRDGTLYEVKTKDFFEIDFSEAGEWLPVENEKDLALPTTFINANIIAYINENYAGIDVRHIEKEQTRYEVELTNDVDLLFTLEGEYIGLDK